MIESWERFFNVLGGRRLRISLAFVLLLLVYIASFVAVELKLILPVVLKRDVLNLIRFCEDSFAAYALTNYDIPNPTIHCRLLEVDTDAFYTAYAVQVFEHLGIQVFGPPLAFRYDSSAFLDPDRISIFRIYGDPERGPFAEVDWLEHGITQDDGP